MSGEFGKALSSLRDGIERVRHVWTDPVIAALEEPNASSNDAPPQPQGDLARLLSILHSFPNLVGYLNARREESFGRIESEADVQDLLYLSLKPAFADLVYEEPTTKGAVGYSIGDFSLPSLMAILEVKYLDEKRRPQTIAHEISEDIWHYSDQTHCELIIFFVYDPHLRIPDRASFIRSSTADDLSVRGRDIRVMTIVLP